MTSLKMTGLIEGRIVHYVLTEKDAEQINAERTKAGPKQRIGNSVMAGQHFPAIVTLVNHREFGEVPGVNLQVFLDGNDSHWVTSRKFAEPAEIELGSWHWVEPA